MYYLMDLFLLRILIERIIDWVLANFVLPALITEPALVMSPEDWKSATRLLLQNCDGSYVYTDSWPWGLTDEGGPRCYSAIYSATYLPLKYLGIPASQHFLLLAAKQLVAWWWNWWWLGAWYKFVAILVAVKWLVWVLLALLIYSTLRASREELLMWVFYTTFVLLGVHFWPVCWEILNGPMVVMSDADRVTVFFLLMRHYSLFVPFLWFFHKQVQVTFIVSVLLNVHWDPFLAALSYLGYIIH